MLDAWSDALLWFEQGASKPNAVNAVELGKRIERIKNQDGVRKCGVRVGVYVAPPPNEIWPRLGDLFLERDDLSPKCPLVQQKQLYTFREQFVEEYGAAGIHSSPSSHAIVLFGGSQPYHVIATSASLADAICQVAYERLRPAAQRTGEKNELP